MIELTHNCKAGEIQHCAAPKLALVPRRRCNWLGCQQRERAPALVWPCTQLCGAAACLLGVRMPSMGSSRAELCYAGHGELARSWAHQESVRAALPLCYADVARRRRLRRGALFRCCGRYSIFRGARWCARARWSAGGEEWIDSGAYRNRQGSKAGRTALARFAGMHLRFSATRCFTSSTLTNAASVSCSSY